MNRLGHIALMYAKENGHLPVVEYLVEKGADIQAQNKVSDVII